MAIGRDADRIYVFDDLGGEDGYFYVSDGDVLVRQSSLPYGDCYRMANEDPPRTLCAAQRWIRTDAFRTPPAGISMTVGHSAARRDSVLRRGRRLEMLGESALQAFDLRTEEPTITMEYLAESAEGEYLLVTRPSDDWDSGTLRVWFGPRDAIQERKASWLGRQRDGGTTTVHFEVDGVEARAFFPVRHTNHTLTIGEETQPLIWVWEDRRAFDSVRASQDLRFVCSTQWLDPLPEENG